jgi:hypothetical protein
MWKNIVQPDRPQMTIWRMRVACWIINAKKIPNIVLIAFPLEKKIIALNYTSITLYVYRLSSLNIFYHANVTSPP